MADGATHSLVGYWNPTGTVYSVSYIERDSYPQGIGRYLDAKVRTLDEVENFVNKQPNHLIHKTVDDYLKYAINLDVEYLFLYDGLVCI